MTPHEKMIWRAMRERLPAGRAHFRRQVVVGSYIVDFCDLGARLVVEIDGNQHGEPVARERDQIRDAFLRDQFFRVLRFSNAEVQQQIDVVLDTILAALDRTG